MKITATRKINLTALRNLCIKENWYTYGTNESYSVLLHQTDVENITDEHLAMMAEDIIENSNPKCFADCEPNGIKPIEHVMYELAEISHTFFEVA